MFFQNINNSITNHCDHHYYWSIPHEGGSPNITLFRGGRYPKHQYIIGPRGEGGEDWKKPNYIMRYFNRTLHVGPMDSHKIGALNS